MYFRYYYCSKCIVYILSHLVFTHLGSGSMANNELIGFCCVVLVTQSCLTLCDPMDYSPPGSSVHGILQERIPEWVVIPFSRGSSQPRDRTWKFPRASVHDLVVTPRPPGGAILAKKELENKLSLLLLDVSVWSCMRVS